MESVFYGFETLNLISMNAREKLDEFAEMTGMNKNQLIGWSIAADFAEWYAEQVKNCSIPAVIKSLPEYNEILYHARALSNEQFREYWDEVQGNVL